MNHLKAINITLEGRVQGVGCRRFLLDKAIELSIKGHIKNLPDGTVFAFATGTNLQLDEFLEWCHKGSPVAKVRKVTVEQTEVSDATCFKIKRN